MLWNTPHDMDGMVLVIPVQDKDTWSFVILRVALDHHSVCHSYNDIAHKNTIFGQLIITMI